MIKFHLAITTAALAVGCISDGADGPDDVDQLLFGLTVEEVLAVKQVSTLAMTDDEWLAAHRGGFACARYGDLCTMIGPDAASDVIELGYRMAITGEARADIDAAQDAAIEAARTEWVDTEAAVFTLNGNTQHFMFGVWLPQPADEICGTMTATFTESDGDLLPYANTACSTNATILSLPPFTRSAAALLTEVSCTAERESLSAAGSSFEFNDP